MRVNNPFYKKVSKEIKKWIKKEFPPDRERASVTDSKRGVKSDFDDKELEEIALEVKVALKGEEINYLKLQEITGIGRNVWARRIPDFIKDLNLPAAALRDRNIDLNEHDEIYHTNIDMIVERDGHNRSKLIHHLYHLDESRIKYFQEAKKWKKEYELLQENQETIKKLSKENKKLKEQLAYYLYQYENLSVSSYFPELRKITGANEGILNLKSDPVKNTNIANPIVLFPSVKETAAANEIIDEKILENKPRKAGEELVEDIKADFPELFKDEQF